MVSKLKIIVIRWSCDRFTLSKPCKHCVEFLKNIGIKKIYYSDDYNNIIYENINTIVTDHISMYYKYFG